MSDMIGTDVGCESLRNRALVKITMLAVRILPILALLATSLIGHLALAEEETRALDEPITPIPRPPKDDPKHVALGAALFDDPDLSSAGKTSCASCHDLRTNGAFPGAAKRSGEVKIVTVFNASLGFRLGWLGASATLEDQAAKSIQGAHLLGNTPAGAVAALRSDVRMAKNFQLAYGRSPDWPSMLDAIATFERSLLTPDSRFDRWLEGDDASLNSDELTGYRLFKSIGCASCHQGVDMGGNLFERQGAVHPVRVPDHRLFLVPSLRNIAELAPYFSDGSVPTLHEAIIRMASLQLGRTLDSNEVSSIEAFLRTLTGRYAGRTVTGPD